MQKNGTLFGFYAINTHTLQYGELPTKFARTRPSHDNIPAACISMIGHDQRFHGGGDGSDLLVDALHRIARAAEALGIAIALLDVLDCGDPAKVARRRALYAGFGFTALRSNPLRMFLPISTIRALLAEEQTE